MATKIRLKRIGRRNRPFYRIVVMDERARRDGAAIEELGWFNPLEIDDEKNLSLKEDRILHWLGEGAQTTETAHNILKRTGLAHRWHLISKGLDDAAVEKEMKKWALEREEVVKSRAENVAKKAEEKQQAAEQEAEAAAAAEAVEETPVEATETKEAEAVAETQEDDTTEEDQTDEATAEPVTEDAPAEESADESMEEATEEPVAEETSEEKTDEKPQAEEGETAEAVAETDRKSVV